MIDPKNPTNTDTTPERPPVDDSASAPEALRDKLTDAQIRDLAAVLAPYGVNLVAALASQDDDQPPLPINIGPLPASKNMTNIRITRVTARSLYGWKPGETLYEAITRKKSEED